MPVLNQSNHPNARVVELVDSLASGASALYGRAGSTPASRTNPVDIRPRDFFVSLTARTANACEADRSAGVFCLVGRYFSLSNRPA